MDIVRLGILQGLKKCIKYKYFSETIFFEEEISDIFFVRNFCLSSILSLEFRSFLDNMGVARKLAGKQWLEWPISAENSRKLCKDIYFPPKKFWSQKFLSIPKNSHFEKISFKKSWSYGSRIIYIKFGFKKTKSYLEQKQTGQKFLFFFW